MKVILALFMLLLAAQAQARDIWVDPNGSDANPCTDSATQLPAKSSRRFIQGLNTCTPTLGPDDVVHIVSGTYTGIQGTSNGGTLPSGTAGHPITFVSVTQYGATVPWIAGNDYWVLDGFTVNGFLDPINDCVAIGTGTTFKNSEIKNCSNQGLSSTLGSLLIQNNIIHHVALSGNALDHGMYLHADNSIVENNEIYDINGGWGIQFYSGTASNNIVRFNKIYDFAGGGIVLAPTGASNNRVYGNRIYNGRGSAPGMTNTSGSSHLVYNNTFYNLNIGIGAGSGTVTIKNNIFSSVTTPIESSGGFTTGFNTCDSVAYGCASAATASQLFANAADLTFVLKTTVTQSPAIDTGTTAIDAGVTIPTCLTSSPLCYNGANPDRGAMESGASVSAPVVTITQPVGCTGTSTACTVTAASLNLAGTATSSGSLNAPTWSCDRCSSGTATGTSSWTVSGITLKAGINIITVTETDSLSLSGADIITVTYAPTFPGNGLVLALPFENGSGTSATDLSGSVPANTGTLIGSPTWVGVNGGRYGNAVQLNGTTQYISVADANSLDFTQSFSITMWVRPTTSYNTYRALVHKNDSSNNSPYDLYASGEAYNACLAGGIIGLITVNGATGPRTEICNSTPLQTPATWTHLGLTWDGTTMKLYRQGVLVSSVAQSGYLEPSTGALLIGASEFGEFFEGLIDELRVYNFALPLTGGANTVFGNNCTRADDVAIATASIIGNANCPITAPTPPLSIKISSAAAGFKVSAGASSLKLGSVSGAQ